MTGAAPKQPATSQVASAGTTVTTTATETTTSPTATATTRFSGLEGLRTIGVIAVFFTHNGFATGVTFGSSWKVTVAHHSFRPASLLGHLEIGPAIFFMISAFLLYRPFVTAAFRDTAAPSSLRFLRRRCVRVFPAYWIAIAGLAATHSIALQGFGHWIKVLTLTQIYTEHDFGAINTLVPTWTLATELTFYFFLVGYALLLRRIGRGLAPSKRLRLELGAVGALLVSAALFRELVYNWSALPHVAEHWLPGTIDLFALGLGLAAIDAFVRSGNPVPRSIAVIVRRPNVCAMVAFGWYLAVPVFTNASMGIDFSTGWDAFGRDLFQMLCAFSLFVPLVFGDQSVGWYRKLVQLKPMAFVGMVSYGIYLWHDHWIVEALRWSGGRVALTGHFWLVGISAFAVSLVFGAVSYFAIEQPALEFDARRAKRGAVRVANSSVLP